MTNAEQTYGVMIVWVAHRGGFRPVVEADGMRFDCADKRDAEQLVRELRADRAAE